MAMDTEPQRPQNTNSPTPLATELGLYRYTTGPWRVEAPTTNGVRRFENDFGGGVAVLLLTGAVAVSNFRPQSPFDIEGVHWSHRGENGERCTFDTMIDEWALRSAARRSSVR